MTLWGRADTQAGGPFSAINDFDIMVNCAYLAPGTLPFVTKQSLGETPNIRIISDVSCDPNSSGNPIPIYSAQPAPKSSETGYPLGTFARAGNVTKRHTCSYEFPTVV